MANSLISYGLDFLEKDEESFSGLLGYTASNGKMIPGYYGLPYLYKQAGHIEFWESTELTDDNKYGISAFHTHASSRNVWDFIVSDIDLSPKWMPKTERVLMLYRNSDSSGMLPVDIINADVLPSFLAGDKLSLQVVAQCLEINYYESEDDLMSTIEPDKRGRKWSIAKGSLFPASFLVNHSVGNNSEDQEYDNDHYVSFTAAVKELYYGKLELNGEEENIFIRCLADTQFGEIQFHHTIEQVPEGLRKNIRKGAIISGVCVISADAAINDYTNGIVRDFDHDLRLLRYALQKGESERLRSVLTEDTCYETDTSGKRYIGPDEIINRFNYVHENHGGNYIAHMAEITSTDEPDLENAVGTRCLVLADEDTPDKYESIVFLQTDSDGNIKHIHVCTDSRYHFRTEVPEHIKTPLDDVEIPQSVIHPILIRAHFHGLIGNDIDETQILDDPDYRMHSNNAKLMLEALSEDPQEDIESAVDRILGYLFAKSIEQTLSSSKANSSNDMNLIVSYSAEDALLGRIHSSLDPKRHELLEEEMELGTQFGKDLRFYMKANGSPDAEFTSIFSQAAVAVQRIGQIYALTEFEKRVDH